MSDYYSDLDKIKAAGRKYAENCLAAGETEPLDSPFSGEWADGLTGQDALNAAGIKAVFADLEDFEQTDVLDSWESGYFSAAWPESARSCRIERTSLGGGVICAECGDECECVVCAN